jgi:hypothetical protein
MVPSRLGPQRPATRSGALMRLLSVTLLAALVVGLTACGGGSDDTQVKAGGSSTSSSTTSSSTTSSSTTTAPTTAPPTTVSSQTSPPVTIGIICSAPEDAAKSLVDSWIAGDQAAAARCAAPDVVTQLFQTNGSGAQWMFQGCNLGDDPGVPKCGYSYEGGAAFLNLNGTESSGWKVVALSYVAD